MFKTIRYRKEFQAWQKKYDALAPKPGDVAPDFELRDVNGENPIRLSDFRGQKPVVLVFGSFT
jgi:peroxiredoxin